MPKTATDRPGAGLTRKEAAIVEACYFRPHYSSNASTKFWREVRHAANDRTLYDFACALQEMESRVLAVLNTGVRVRTRKLVLAKRAATNSQAVTFRRPRR